MADLIGKKVAFIVSDAFEQVEYTGPRDALESAGVTTALLSPKSDSVQGLNHIDKADTFTVTQKLEDADPKTYDALVIPGGVVNSDELRMDDMAKSWVATFLAEGKPTAVICHGPWLLVSADLVKGRKLTSWPTLQDDIRNAGGEWVDEMVVVDGALITSRKPDDIPAFSEALIEKLSL